MQEHFDAATVARFENETWSRCAKRYIDGFGALVAEGVDALLDEVKVSAGDRVLDVGTGPGLVAAVAADRGAHPIGLDFSEAMLAEARQLHPQIEFARGLPRRCLLGTASLTRSSVTSCFITWATRRRR